MLTMCNLTTDQRVWYSEALEELGPLRYHIHELLQAVESHNRFAEHYNGIKGETDVRAIKIPDRVIDAAKQASEQCEEFFCGSKK